MNIGILNRAIYEAQKSEFRKYKIGSVIFKGPRIISSGHNYYGSCSKIHPKYRNKRDTVHSEQSSVMKVKNWKKTKNASMLIIRISKKGDLSMALPCKMCMNIIKHCGIKEIFYSNRRGEIIHKKLK